MIDINNIENVNWEWKYQDFESLFPMIKKNSEYIECVGKIRNIDFKGIIQFSESNNKLNKITLLIPPDVFRNSSAGSEINDYLKTYYILEQILGLPVFSKGIKADELEKIRNIYDISKDIFPINVWFLGRLKIIHTFIDHWGFVPETYAERR
jgi:hypothetical protein